MDALTKWSANGAKNRRRCDSRASRLILCVLPCAFALGGSVYGYYWWAVDRFFQSTDDAYVGGNVTPISPHIAGFVADSR